MCSNSNVINVVLQVVLAFVGGMLGAYVAEKMWPVNTPNVSRHSDCYGCKWVCDTTKECSCTKDKEGKVCTKPTESNRDC